MIVYGKRLYGYCDAVPGRCHVATQFVHIWFVPLVPLGSYLIVEESDDAKSGMSIGFSVKSLLLAWARAGIVVSILGGLIGGIMQLADGEIAVGIGLVVVAIVCVGLLLASYKLLSSASPARTQELLARLGVPRAELFAQLQAAQQEPPQGPPQQQPWQQQPQPQQQPWQQQPQPQQQPWQQQQPQPQQQPWQQQPQPQQQPWQQQPQPQQQPWQQQPQPQQQPWQQQPQQQPWQQQPQPQQQAHQWPQQPQQQPTPLQPLPPDDPRRR